MPKFITATSLVLFAAFYQLSGGTEFEPAERNVVEAQGPFAAAANTQMFGADDGTNEDLIVRVGYTVTPAAPALPTATGGDDAVIQNASLSTAGLATTVTPELNLELLEDSMDIRLVSGDWVNMRSGPGTTYEVLNTLPYGTMTELVSTDGNWAQIRLTETGELGWMSMNLLTEG